jgi:hypothetical protein
MKSYVSRFPVPGEWHGVAGSVMPVWYDVHRTCDATFLADEAAGDRRPRQVFTAAEKTELWDRWKRGESLKAIGRAFGNSKGFCEYKP